MARASSGSISGIPSRTAYASLSARQISSSELPEPELRNGPLQIGHTNKSSSRLSITPSCARRALGDSPNHDVEQQVRLAAVETRAYRHVPMLRPGYRRTFYGIFLRHE